MLKDVVTELVDQHEAIREAIDGCMRLADALEAGAIDVETLTLAVARLRVMVKAHDDLEERMMWPMFGELGLDAGTIDALVEHHTAEHDELMSQLVGDSISILRAAVGRMRAHMLAEERRFRQMRSTRDLRRSEL